VPPSGPYRMVIGASRLQPAVSVVEDLHWLDPSTLELQQLLVEEGATVPLMLLYTARPQFRIPWRNRAHHTQVTLDRLSSRDVRQMVSLVAAHNALAGESVDAVVERTGGVPLFIEELTRSVLEGSTQKNSRTIPATLHDSLMARLDRLGGAKEVVQIGAVIGSEFSHRLLHAVHPILDKDLQNAIRSALDAELVYVRGIPPDAVYQFKHALIRDAAYEALLKSRRRDLHRRVAVAINERFTEIKDGHPEVLAHHWTEAGETELAISQWTKAGKQAETRNAFEEALGDYDRALAVVNTVPESAERNSHELELRRSIIALLHVTKGYAAPDTVEAVESAIALAETSGDVKTLVSLLASRGSTLTIGGDLKAASRILDRALELALRQPTPTNLALVHMQQNLVRFHRGDLTGAEEHFEAWVLLFEDPTVKQTLNLAVNALHFGSCTAWLLGHVEAANERHRRMLAVAKTGGAFEVANSEYCAALYMIFLRDYRQAVILAKRALEIAEQHQFPNPAARSRCQLGWALAYLGHATEGVAMIQQGIIAVRQIGTRMGLSVAISGLAEAQRLAGDMTAALETIELALQALPEELAYRPETLRVRGQLHLDQEQTDLAEADFYDAIALAQRIGAKTWELRASISLARLLAKQGHRREAGTRLAEIYGWFTDGFDTSDLRDAKALLDELSV
jgi:tetratricopeptide (TPR) repeat protein